MTILCTELGDIIGYTYYMREWEHSSSLFTDKDA